MKSYRDYLDDRGIPKGPWIVDGPRLQSSAIAMARDSAETACPAPVPVRTAKRGPSGIARQPDLRIVA